MIVNFLSPYAQQSTPKWWRWYAWVCPVAYTLYGLIASQFGDITDKEIVVGDNSRQTVQKFISDYFGFDHDYVWAVAIAVAGFAVIFGATFAYSIKAFNFQRR